MGNWMPKELSPPEYSIHEDPSTPKRDPDNAQEASGDAEDVLPSKLKNLALDPRSPSGIPRTPILVEDENQSGSASGSKDDQTNSNDSPKRHVKKVKRGQMKLPVSKLVFTKASEEIENQIENENLEKSKNLKKKQISATTINTDIDQQENILIVENSPQKNIVQIPPSNGSNEEEQREPLKMVDSNNAGNVNNTVVI